MKSPNYFYSVEGDQVQGPVSLIGLQRLVEKGVLTAGSRISHEDEIAWQPLDPAWLEAEIAAAPPTSPPRGRSPAFYLGAACIAVMILAFFTSESKEPLALLHREFVFVGAAFFIFLISYAISHFFRPPERPIVWTSCAAVLSFATIIGSARHPDLVDKVLPFSEEPVVRDVTTSNELGFARACAEGLARAKAQFALFGPLNPSTLGRWNEIDFRTVLLIKLLPLQRQTVQGLQNFQISWQQDQALHSQDDERELLAAFHGKTLNQVIALQKDILAELESELMILRFLDVNKSKWHPEPKGNIIFSDPSLEKDYQSLLSSLKQCVENVSRAES